MVIIVDGQNVSGIVSYLILRKGVDFRDIIQAAFFNKENIFIREARIIYRDTIKGKRQHQVMVERHLKLVEALKRQGIEVLDIPKSVGTPPRKKFNLDSLIKEDLRTAINDADTRAIVLLSGDGDFAPFAKMAREKGIKFIVIGNNGSISPTLIDNADQAFKFQDLLPVLTA